MLFFVGGSFTFVQDFLVGRSDVEIWIGDYLDFVEENPTGPIPRRQNQHWEVEVMNFISIYK